MLVLPEHNAVFIHVPKTGGTWVRKVIQELGIKHHEIGGKHTYNQSICNDAQYIYSVYRGWRTWQESYWLMKQRGANNMNCKPTYNNPKKDMPRGWEGFDLHCGGSQDSFNNDQTFALFNEMMKYYQKAGHIENHYYGAYFLLMEHTNMWLNKIGVSVNIDDLSEISPANTRNHFHHQDTREL